MMDVSLNREYSIVSISKNTCTNRKSKKKNLRELTNNQFPGAYIKTMMSNEVKV